MSLWNCAEHGLHGPMLGNLCPTCGQEMTWTTTTIASSERAERTHIVNPTPPPASGPTGTPEAERLADRIVQAVGELPDRTSPDDWPEAMLVTADELHSIVLDAARLTGEASAPAQDQTAAREHVRFLRESNAQMWDGGKEAMEHRRTCTNPDDRGCRYVQAVEGLEQFVAAASPVRAPQEDALRALIVKWRSEADKDYQMRHGDDSGGIWAYQHEAAGSYQKARACASELEAALIVSARSDPQEGGQG